MDASQACDGDMPLAGMRAEPYDVSTNETRKD